MFTHCLPLLIRISDADIGMTVRRLAVLGYSLQSSCASQCLSRQCVAIGRIDDRIHLAVENNRRNNPAGAFRHLRPPPHSVER